MERKVADSIKSKYGRDNTKLIQYWLKAYAAKQKDVWKRFRKNAEERFGKYMTFSEI